MKYLLLILMILTPTFGFSMGTVTVCDKYKNEATFYKEAYMMCKYPPESGCKVWYDGCNTHTLVEDGHWVVTGDYCEEYKTPRCLDKEKKTHSIVTIPLDPSKINTVEAEMNNIYIEKLAKTKDVVKHLADSGNICEVYGHQWIETEDECIEYDSISGCSKWGKPIKRICNICEKLQIYHEEWKDK